MNNIRKKFVINSPDDQSNKWYLKSKSQHINISMDKSKFSNKNTLVDSHRINNSVPFFYAKGWKKEQIYLNKLDESGVNSNNISIPVNIGTRL